ncbi:MAG: fatty acid hydroxylase [Verrucomicrobiota bacterium]
MYELLFWSGVGFAAAIIFASFFEWTLHKYVMHRPVGKFQYAFRAHAVIHHHVFKADHTYHLIDERDKETIPMAWWNGPVLIATCQLPFLAWAWATGHWALLMGSTVACSAYYGAYEYMHWCMHLPKRRNIERSGIFFRLNGHHLLHHRYMHKNFNVVLPLADLCLGTLMVRSNVQFAQARGPAVPDVQPRTRASRAKSTAKREEELAITE